MSEDHLILELGIVLCMIGMLAFWIRSLLQEKSLLQRWQFAINANSQGLWDWNIRTNKTLSSNGWKIMLGYEPDEVDDSVLAWDRLIHPDDKKHVYAAINKHLNGETPHYESEHRMLRKDGTYLWVRDQGEVTDFDRHGKPLRMVGTQTNINQRKNAETANLEQQALTKQLIKNQSVATFMIDANHQVIHWNDACEVLTGAKATDMIGKDEAWRGFYPEPRPCLADLILNEQQAVAGHYYQTQGPSTLLKKTSWHAEAWFENLGGERRYVIFDAAPIFNTAGEIVAVVETLQDVTESKLTEQALIDEKSTSEQIKKSLENQKYALDQHAIVAKTDIQGNITYANDKFCDISGYSREELLGQNHRMLRSNIHPESYFKAMYRTIAQGHVWHGEICNKNKSGALYWVDTTIVPLMNDDDKPIEYIAIRTDITDRKHAEEETKKLAYYDSLTGLANRRLLFEHLHQSLALSKRNHFYGAVLFLDLNHFKALNDEMGHDVGDLLLQQVAARLSICSREADTVARLGGDEFVILLNNLSVDASDAQTKVNFVKRKVLDTLSKPYDLNGYMYTNIPSIGVSLLHPSEGDETEILKKADIAMYKEKMAARKKRA